MNNFSHNEIEHGKQFLKKLANNTDQLEDIKFHEIKELIISLNKNLEKKKINDNIFQSISIEKDKLAIGMRKENNSKITFGVDVYDTLCYFYNRYENNNHYFKSIIHKDQNLYSINDKKDHEQIFLTLRSDQSKRYFDFFIKNNNNEEDNIIITIYDTEKNEILEEKSYKISKDTKQLSVLKLFILQDEKIFKYLFNEEKKIEENLR
jgi:hypothetical protein